jgi:rubredoxin
LNEENWKVTRAEAESVVRAITRTCRGHARLTADVRQDLHVRWNAALEASDLPTLFSVTREAEQKAKMWQPPDDSIDKVDIHILSQRAANSIFSFTEDCGADVNDVICSVEFDGKEHERVCPKCGVKDTFIAPIFVIE